MHKTVVVLGAGATLGQASELRPRKRKEHPPLDVNFFATAKGLAGNSKPIAAQIARLEEAIVRSGQFISPFVDCTDRLESFFADVFYEVSSSKSTDPLPVFLELLALYNRVLGQTTNWVAANKKLAGFDKLLRAEMRAGNQITLISFNQDLLAENVVNRLPRSSGQWCLKCLYGHPPLELVGSPRRLFAWDENCSHEFPVRLLKLHGSLNWFVATRDPRPSIPALFPGMKKKVIHVVEDGEIRVGAVRMSTGRSRGRANWYLWPLVVPPIYDKHLLTGTQVIDHQWAAARQAVLEAHRLIIWGYSIPDADVLSAQMLRRSFADNERLEVVHCVNPDSHIVPRVKAKLYAPVVHLYDDIEKYLSHGQTA